MKWYAIEDMYSSNTCVNLDLCSGFKQLGSIIRFYTNDGITDAHFENEEKAIEEFKRIKFLHCGIFNTPRVTVGCCGPSS